MSRPLVAAASLVAMGAAFAAVTVLLGGERDGAGLPRVALAPEATSVGRATGPAPSPPAEEPATLPPHPRDSEAFVRELTRAGERQEQALRDAVLAPLASEDATIDEKLDGYRRALRGALEQAPKEPLPAPELRGPLTEVFLRAESVQKELAALGPGARQREIDHIRREMGYSDEEIARMADRDAYRESRWQNGLACMEERARIARTFDGEVLDDELRSLRERYFADEAKTIELEEREGFFRFERARVYGRN